LYKKRSRYSYVSVAGDTRFDRVIQVAEQHKIYDELYLFIDNKFTWILGSAWAADMNVFREYIASHPEDRYVIAPHEIDEDTLTEIESYLDTATTARWSSITDWHTAGSYRVLIVDSIGKLSSLYRYGTVAYIGGGFGKGIHNTLEAAVYGIPVLFGPAYTKFHEAKALIACGGAASIQDRKELETIAATWKSEKEYNDTASRAKSYVASHTGATALVMTCIHSLPDAT
jgi:3-deoxy-D-manno-octulosonic-acid transferase